MFLPRQRQRARAIAPSKKPGPKGRSGMKNRVLIGLFAGTVLGSAPQPALAETQTGNPPDTANGTQPDTIAPQAGQTIPPTTNAQGETVRNAGDIVITG